ncbi:substrate-binding periplasmic protein [Dongshaea marina]|uniref:substrate-binding periplasmic protein n=1 Tax=Dongshaea marina TaxID=2047966 RepID=UPI000D3E2065|nr:transporter substrate-binding domain-containing protein [Dongshaea marina]
MRFLLLFVLGCFSSVSASPVVRLATLTDYPPFCFYQEGAERIIHEQLAPGEESRRFTGLAYDVVIKSFHKAGYRVELTIAPWSRVIKLLQSGLVDAVFPAVKNPERLARYLFSESLVYPQNHYLLYVSRNRPSTLRGDGLAMLSGLRVGVYRDFSYGTRWEQLIESNLQIHRHRFSEFEHGFRLLDRGRIDALVGYELSFDYALHRLGWKEKFRKLEPFAISRSYLMLGKDQGRMRQEFDLGYRALVADGTYHRLLKRWGVEGDE